MVLIPYPKKLASKSGIFHINRSIIILLDMSCDYSDYEAAAELRNEIGKSTGALPSITKGEADMNRLAAQSAGMIILQKAGAVLSGSAENARHGKARSAPVPAAIPAVPAVQTAPGIRTPSATQTAPATSAAPAIHAAETSETQAYRLLITEEIIMVTGFSSAGLFYGIQTLRQIVRGCGTALPCLEIEDSPDFEFRGFYHDVTRGRVPKLETLLELANRLSFYKINQLQLYIEHSFAFRAHSEIWADSDPLKPEDILVLDEYCRRRGMELVPSISTFGHLYHALVSKSFGMLNEYEQIPDRPFTWAERMSHYTLDVSNPASLQFVRDMIDEYLPLFSSDKFNIGCDETFDLGRGRNRPLAESIGIGKLYLYFVREIISYVKSKNRSVMLWGDILLKYPEILKELPKDVTVLNWNYDPCATEEGIKTIADAGLAQYACPGTRGWNRLINDIDGSFKNIGLMSSYALKYRAKGILNTDWGDFGHINLLAGSIPGAVYGAGLSWNAARSEGPSDVEISKLEYGDGSGRLVGLMRELSRQALLDWETAVLWYYSAAGLDAEGYGYKEHHIKRMLECSESSVKAAYSRIGELRDEIAAVGRNILPERKRDLKELLVAAEGLALMQALLLVIKKKFLGQKTVGLIMEPEELAVKLEYWLAEYKAVWRESCRESELYRIKEVIMGICGLLRS